MNANFLKQCGMTVEGIASATGDLAIQMDERLMRMEPQQLISEIGAMANNLLLSANQLTRYESAIAMQQRAVILAFKLADAAKRARPSTC